MQVLIFLPLEPKHYLLSTPAKFRSLSMVICLQAFILLPKLLHFTDLLMAIPFIWCHYSAPTDLQVFARYNKSCCQDFLINMLHLCPELYIQNLTTETNVFVAQTRQQAPKLPSIPTIIHCQSRFSFQMLIISRALYNCRFS
jgi:hypothetical protein